MSDNRSIAEMESQLESIKNSPTNAGTVKLILSRPKTNKREIIEHATLDVHTGLVGDNWLARPDKHTADGKADPGRQLTIMNSRSIAAIAGEQEQWAGAGDQLFVDFDLSDLNIPAGTQLSIGDAVVEVTDLPHLGCRKFATRYGNDACVFTNSDQGKALNLRGINARVVQGGKVSKGDTVQKR